MARPTPPETGENRNYKAIVYWSPFGSWDWRVQTREGKHIDSGHAPTRRNAWRKAKAAVEMQRKRDAPPSTEVRWFA